MMNEQLEAARVAWMEAEQRAEQYTNDDREKAAKWRAAIAHLDNIPERIVSGEQLHKADLTQAKAAAADAKNNSTMAEALARAGRRRADEAELNYLSEKAKDFRLRHDAAKSAVLEQSIRLDRAIAKANDVAGDLADAERDMADIAAEARQFNLALEARINGGAGQRSNEVMQELQQAEIPRARLDRFAHPVPPPRLRAELVRSERGHRLPASGVFDVVISKTAEQVVRDTHNIPQPPPPPPPAPEVQQEPADEEPAEQFAVAAE